MLFAGKCGPAGSQHAGLLPPWLPALLWQAAAQAKTGTGGRPQDLSQDQQWQQPRGLCLNMDSHMNSTSQSESQEARERKGEGNNNYPLSLIHLHQCSNTITQTDRNTDTWAKQQIQLKVTVCHLNMFTHSVVSAPDSMCKPRTSGYWKMFLYN